MDHLARTRTDVEAALTRAGFDASEIAGRADLITTTSAEFARAAGRPPQWVWWVPGRIEIFGKHTDYAGGRSLVAAVPRGFAVVAAPRGDGVVTARDARWSSEMDIHQDDRTRTFHGWANYVAVAVRRLAQNFAGAALGADIVFSSDLPRAAGLSSSSALTVGIALALVRCAGLDSREDWRASIHNQLELAGYLGALENGLTFGALAGASGVGTHGGSEDHTAILNGAAGRVRAFSYVPVETVGEAAMPADWRFLIMTSGVEAAKAGAARDRYNRASLATRAIVDVWRRDAAGADARTLAQIVADAGGEKALRDAIHGQTHPDFSADALDQRLSHFVAEHGRVLPALAAFGSSDRETIGELAAASQADAEHLLGNQIPQTVTLAALARDSGAFAASSFGAGFGGSVWALADAEASADVLERWRSSYMAACPESTNASGMIIRPAPPAIEIGSDPAQT